MRLVASGRILVKDAHAAVRAAVAGGVLTYRFEKSVARGLAAGSLVQALESWSPGAEPPFFYYSRQRHLPAALRAFTDFARSNEPEWRTG